VRASVIVVAGSASDSSLVHASCASAVITHAAATKPQTLAIVRSVMVAPVLVCEDPRPGTEIRIPREQHRPRTAGESIAGPLRPAASTATFPRKRPPTRVTRLALPERHG